MGPFSMAAKAKYTPLTQIALPLEMVRKLRVITAHWEKSMAEYLVPMIESRVERDYRKVANEIHENGEAGA